MILDFFFSVGGFCALALAASLWLVARPHAARPRRVLLAIVLFYTAASTRVFPWLASRPLLYGFHQFYPGDAPSSGTAVVVLGAGSYTVHGIAQRTGVIDLAGAARVLEAARVFRLLGTPWIISSGGGADGFQTETSAATMRGLLVDLGVPADRVVLEPGSVNTHDEAMLVRPMLPGLHATRIVVVTSDIHMRRSIAAFRAAGIEAVPAIAPDPLNSESPIRSLIPTTEGLRFSSGVAHEYVGLVYYFARGWARFTP